MATITTLRNDIPGLTFRTTLNNNFANLNADKAEATHTHTGTYTPVVDTTALADRVTVNEGDIDTNTADIATNSDRITLLEDSHTLLLVATSTATTQEPTLVDTPIQIEFGPLQSTTDIDISAAGAITFKTAGKYIISPFFQYGRTGASGTSILLNRYLVNGVQAGSSLGSKIDNADVLVPWSSSIQFTAGVNDVLTIEIMRDSVGSNSGGLFAVTPTAAGWATAPCASIQIYKAT